MPEPIALTEYGTPIYVMKTKDKRLLRTVRRTHVQSTYARLRDVIQERYSAPAVVVVKLDKSFARVFKLTAGQTLLPTTAGVIPIEVRRTLVREGVLGKVWTSRRGSKL